MIFIQHKFASHWGTKKWCRKCPEAVTRCWTDKFSVISKYSTHIS